MYRSFIFMMSVITSFSIIFTACNKEKESTLIISSGGNISTCKVVKKDGHVRLEKIKDNDK